MADYSELIKRVRYETNYAEDSRTREALREAGDALEAVQAKRYETLGDIAEELRVMKAQDVTRGSILYALGQVYWEVETPDNS